MQPVSEPALADCLPQATHFLSLMQRMQPDTQRAFLTIYQWAPHTAESPAKRLKGDHVRLAMMEALLHPEMAYWVRLNLAVRVARKLAQTTGNATKLQKLDDTLEAFHVAADAFALQIPLSASQAQRQGRAKPKTSVQPAVENPTGIPDEDVAKIQAFKNRVIPGLVRAIRESVFKSA
ncbi:hypothetical protein [Vampirovibrio sp.]|uniref:hypothetical protein n=1 Tax=Vampirovibrio sp. TaxID=2717857 RepID=UPI003593010E